MALKHLIQLIFLASIWGASYVFTRIAVNEFGIIPLTSMRSLVAALTLLPILFMSKHWPVFVQYWRHILIVGLISTAFPFTLMTTTTYYTSAGFASILNALTPIFSAIVAWLWIKEHLSMAAILGIFLSFIGVLIMVMDKQTISANVAILPVFTGLCAAALYGLTGNYTKQCLSGVSPLVISAGCQLFSAISLLPFAFYLRPAQMPSLTSWGCIIVLGILCTSVGYIMFFQLIEKVGVTRTMVVTYLVPVFGMIWGKVFLSELITYQMLVGAALILGGITLTAGIIKKRKKH